MQRKFYVAYKKRFALSAHKKVSSVRATVANSVPSWKICTKQMFVLVSMNILILKTEIAEF